MRNFILVCSFMALGVSIYFPPVVEDTLAMFFILTIGVIHGANDLILIKKARTFKTTNSFKNLLFYLAIIVVIIVLFCLVSKIALPIFVLFSAYHFGEQHWGGNLKGNTILNSFFYIVYGLFVFSLLFAAHPVEVQEVIYQMSQVYLPLVFFERALIVLAVMVSVLLLIYASKGKLGTFWLEELFFIVVFFVVFNTATLLWGFAVYFVLWHSIPSIKEQVEFLYGKSNRSSVLRYLKLAWVYWLMALLGFAALIYFFGDERSLLLAIFFSFLGAITFPHILVISKMHTKSTLNH
ncbi:MAG: Brp/Blh family beta-carotene 15,15'-dioxygenase [Leeuwenhoekiella sp.]